MHMQAYMNLYIYTYICVYIYFLFPKKDSILYICFIFCYQIIYLDSLEKDPDARKDWRQKEKGAVEDKVVGECHWFNGHAAAAAAAKSLQSCPTLCDPIDGSPPGSPSLGFSRQEHWSGLPFPSPMPESEKWKWSRSVVSHPQRPHGLQPSRLLHPWDFPGKSTGVGCHQRAWMWANSRREWRTEESGVPQSMGLQSQTGLGDQTTIMKYIWRSFHINTQRALCSFFF